MQMTFLPFWFRMVSVAMTVLPVWRSPMMSSRCAADGDHGVDGLDAGLQRDADGFALDDAGGVALDGAQLLRVDGALAVDGLAEGVDDAADEGLADRDGHDAARALDKAPSRMPTSVPSMTTLTQLSSRFSAMPNEPFSKRSSSLDLHLSSPCTLAMPSPT